MWIKTQKLFRAACVKKLMKKNNLPMHFDGSVLLHMIIELILVQTKWEQQHIINRDHSVQSISVVWKIIKYYLFSNIICRSWHVFTNPESTNPDFFLICYRWIFIWEFSQKKIKIKRQFRIREIIWWARYNIESMKVYLLIQ